MPSFLTGDLAARTADRTVKFIIIPLIVTGRGHQEALIEEIDAILEGRGKVVTTAVTPGAETQKILGFIGLVTGLYVDGQNLKLGRPFAKMEAPYFSVL